jgi:hypothetical protein
MPDEPEVHGLLALMLLHDTRRDAGFRDGELVLLAEQDRARWDREQILAGRTSPVGWPSSSPTGGGYPRGFRARGMTRLTEQS